MSAANYVGRVGALALALGVGFAVASGQGIAYADGTETGATSNDSPAESDSAPADESDAPESVDENDEVDEDEPPSDEEEPTVDDPTADEPTADDPSAEEPELDEDKTDDEPAAEDSPTNDPVDHSDTESTTPSTELAEPPAVVDFDDPADDETVASGIDEVPLPEDSPAASMRVLSAPTPVADELTTTSVAVPLALAAPTLRTPIAIVTSVLSAALAPFLAPTPGTPGDSPLLLGVLAWVRRQIHHTFFNQSPSLAYDPVDTEQVDADTVVGSVTGADPDDDDLRYSVTQTTAKGGTVTIDADGEFTYVAPADRPDGPFTDTFTVTVSDAHSGHHLHGLAGLLRADRGHTDTVDVEVTVGEFNTPPSATLSADPPNGDGVIGVRFSYSDSAADSLTVTRPEPALGDWGNGFAMFSSDGVIQTGSWSYTYVPDPWAQLAAYRGTGPLTETLTFTVSDGVNPPVERSVDVQIAPAKTVLVTSVSDPDPETGLVRVTLAYEDADGAPLSFTEPAAEYGTLELESQTVISIMQPDGQSIRNYQRVYRYTPSEAARVEAYYGGASSEELAFSVSDGTAVTARTVTVPILPLEATVPESV